MSEQRGIASQLPSHSRYLVFRAKPEAEFAPVLQELLKLDWDENMVIGFGPCVFESLGRSLKGLRAMPSFEGARVETPQTQGAAWLWLRGDDPGVLLHRSREICSILAPAFIVDETIDAFMYRDSRDLSGYIDGTENPPEERVPEVTFCGAGDPGVEGGAFVSVMRWEHDLSLFQSLSQEQQDHTFGRRLSDNEELADAPSSAHVKRTAQESFVPEAFVLRRSMPYTLGAVQGLMFVAFAASLNPFEALLRRMVGAEDGIVDALFRFTRPLSGSQFFCPPTKEGRLDLRTLL